LTTTKRLGNSSRPLLLPRPPPPPQHRRRWTSWSTHYSKSSGRTAFPNTAPPALSHARNVTNVISHAITCIHMQEISIHAISHAISHAIFHAIFHAINAIHLRACNKNLLDMTVWCLKTVWVFFRRD
jgi:hypothetical protein